MTAAGRLTPALWALALAPLGALAMLVAYRTHPAVPLGAVAVAGAVALAYYRPIAAVCLSIAVVPLEFIFIPVAGTAVTPVELMFILTGGVWALRRIVEARVPWIASPLSLPLALLVLTALPGLLVALDRMVILRFLVFWGSFLLVFWLIVSEADAASIRAIFFTLTLTAAVVSLTSAVGSAEQVELSSTGDWASGRATGAFESPNMLASFLAIAFPAALAVAFGPQRARRLPAALAAVVIFAGIALTLSRAGLMAAVAATLVMLAWAPLRRFAFVALASFALLIPFASNQIGQVEQVNVLVKRVESIQYSTANRNDQRERMYTETPNMIADYWVTGVGALNYPEFAPRYGIVQPGTGETFVHAHNIPLTIGAEFGIPGLIALAWLFVAAGRLMFEAVRTSPAARGAAIAAAAALVGVAVQGIFDFTPRSNIIAPFVFVMLGALTVLARPPAGGRAARAA